MTLASFDLVAAVAKRTGRSSGVEAVVDAVLEELVMATSDGRQLVVRNEAGGGDVVMARTSTEAAVPTRVELLTLAQAAEYLGTTPNHIRSLVYGRKIPYRKLGKYLRFRPADLDAWLETRLTRPRPARR